jgi:hypothetical protein
MDDQDVTNRGATPNDARGLRRLAELDSSILLTGRVLLAELDGAPVAAVSLETGSATADPFQHSAEAVRMLSPPLPDHAPGRRPLSGAVAAATPRTRSGALMSHVVS